MISPLSPHYWLAEISRRTGSNASTLHGALADSGNPYVASCPSEISKIVADKYALTECGRLFHWRRKKLTEHATNLQSGHEVFHIYVHGVRWQVNQKTLQNRLFPDRKLRRDEPIDWDAYDPHGLIPGEGLYDDPLREREKPGDTMVVDRCSFNGPSTNDLDRAHRLFYGE